MAAAYHAQVDALEIESGAKRRLADEYDTAQERGEVAREDSRLMFRLGTLSRPRRKNSALPASRTGSARVWLNVIKPFQHHPGEWPVLFGDL